MWDSAAGDADVLTSATSSPGFPHAPVQGSDEERGGISHHKHEANLSTTVWSVSQCSITQDEMIRQEIVSPPWLLCGITMLTGGVLGASRLVTVLSNITAWVLFEVTIQPRFVNDGPRVGGLSREVCYPA